MICLDELYYRMGLARAKNRDLSGAAVYARTALSLNPENERAKKLLEICLSEIGRPLGLSNHKITINGFIARRRAMSFLGSLPHQSVNILNIQGLICAIAGKYRKSAVFFAAALEKDKGNKLAADGLSAVLKRQQ